MYTQNRNYLYRCAILLLIAGLISPAALEAKQEFQPYRISRGMEIRILKNTGIPFIHAQLVIFYRDKIDNPAIPYLTLLNIFDNNIKKPGTPLLGTLRKLGNDFEVEHRPDFLLFKINFLADKVPLFIRFLKNLYNYRPFMETDGPAASYLQKKRKLSTEERFKDSIKNYWKYFFKKRRWKKSIAFQVAYNQLFPGNVLGQTLITPAHLSSVTFEHLRSFHRRTYRLPNSLLIMKGNIQHPAIVYGSIEHAFSTLKKPRLEKITQEKITIKNRKKVIVFNTDNSDAPAVFWFEPIPTSKTGNPLPNMVLNHLLFGVPAGRIFIAASRSLSVNRVPLQSEMVNHNNVSVICNSVRLRYRDIEKFILLAERQKKKLGFKGISRKEYLDTRSYIFGRLKVNTREVGNDINLEILNKPVQYPPITLAGLNQNTEKRYEPVIVIVGNAKTISRYLTVLNPEVIDFLK